MIKLGYEGFSPAGMVDFGGLMAVEVAIGAFRPAKRPMDINREGFGHGLALRGGDWAFKR